MGYKPVVVTMGPVVVIVGPTAVGKTALALHLAETFDIEIISADSRQIYRGMDIGTAKPSPAEQSRVPHHLLDVVDPDEVLTLAQFQQQTYQLIDAIHQRHRLPVLVGGTGQWVRAVVEGWGIPAVPPDPDLRAELEQRAETEGHDALHADLAAVDPIAAQKIDARNVRRVVRALEVYYKTGRPITVHQRKSPPPYDFLQIGLTLPRETLYARIDRRVDDMLARGLLAEVERLVAAGYRWDKPAMSGLGYRQIGQYLQGAVSLAEAVDLIKYETHRFARQQDTWFRRDDARIQWFDMSGEVTHIYQAVVQLVATSLNARPS